jgi:hypothetical protein
MIPRVVRQKNMAMDPSGLETKNNCAAIYPTRTESILLSVNSSYFLLGSWIHLTVCGSVYPPYFPPFSMRSVSIKLKQAISSSQNFLFFNEIIINPLKKELEPWPETSYVWNIPLETKHIQRKYS